MNGRQIVSATSKFLRRHSTGILSASSIILMGLTIYGTVKGTLKAQEKVQELRDETGEDISGKEIVKAIAPCFIFPAATAIAAVSCIVGGAVINRKQQTSLLAAYGVTAHQFSEYRKVLIEKHGEEIDNEVSEELSRRYSNYHVKGVDTPDVKYIWYDDYSGNSIEAYEKEIMDAEYHLNRNFVMSGYVTLNEFYDMLGMPKTDEGYKLGWSIMDDGYVWIDFEHELLDRDDGGMPCAAVHFVFPPEYIFEEEKADIELPWN